MRTADQVKTKLIQLKELQKKFNMEEIRLQIDILEWVLNEPTEKYHS
jgi:hypothetical protein